MKSLAILACASVIAMAAQPAKAHPHILTEYTIVATIKDGKFVGLRVTWTFDELYSELVRETVDRNKNGKFDTDEIIDVARKSIPTMKPRGFYTYLTVGGKTTQPNSIDDFDAKLEDGKVSYLFSIGLPDGVSEFTFSAYDIEYYIDFYPAKAAFRIEGGKGNCQIGKGTEIKTDGWGTLTPPTIACKAQ